MTAASRNFRLFLAFRGTTRALLFAPYIFHFMTEVRGLSFAEYGLMQSIYYWVVMAAEVPSGVIADRLGRRGTLFLGALVNGIGCFTFAVSFDLPMFALGEVLFALGTALISGADSAILYDSLAAENRQTEYARAEGAGQATWLTVTAVGMPLTDLFLVRGNDPVLAYWLSGSLSLIGAVAALAMTEPPRGERQSTREITVGAMKDVVHRPPVLRIILYSVGVFILLRAAIVMFSNPVLAASGVPVNRYGMVLAIVNVFGAFTAFRGHRILERYGERAFMVAMPIALIVMFALLLVVRTPWVIALFCIQGAVFGIYPLIRTILNRHVGSASRRATVISIESMACRVAFGLIALFTGVALESYGLNWAIAATTVAGCVPLVTVILIRRRTRSV